jgi:hypothetical protein
MVICYSLTAWLWCAIGAFAQERPASKQPKNVCPPTANVEATNGNPWEEIEWVERRYKIEAMGFKAIDETGWFDWTGDDDVKVHTIDAKGYTVSKEIQTIDTGETYDFDPDKSCIIPVRPGIVVLGSSSVCDNIGEPAPLGFYVEMWEQDWGYGFCGTTPPLPGDHSSPSCSHDAADDFLGSAQIDLSQQDLDAVLPEVGNEYIETVLLYPCPGYECGGINFEYHFTYRITRLPDVRVDLRSVIDEAIQRSGTCSDLEAIVAGLRSLRMPSTRKVMSGSVAKFK